MKVRKLVALSGGKDSTAMALRLAESEPADYEYLITPTGRELPPVEAHWKHLESLLGKPLIRIPAPTMGELIVKFGALPNWRMRWCTRLIKIEPFMAFASDAAPATVYVGIRADEVIGEDAREGTDWSGVIGVKQDFPLVRWGWGLSRVIRYVEDMNAVPPKRTDCDFCFFQRLIEWWELWKDWPERYKQAEAYEIWTGHTFRSAQRDSWPASLTGLRHEFEHGRIPKETRGQERTAMCSWCAR